MRLSVDAILDPTVQSTTFGGNFLFNRDELGDGSGNFNALANELGVDSLRYPGGAITEFMFDLENPDSTVGYDINGKEHELVGLSDFLDYAEAEGKSVTIVLPTRDFLSSATYMNGNRFAQFDDDMIKGELPMDLPETSADGAPTPLVMRFEDSTGGELVTTERQGGLPR